MLGYVRSGYFMDIGLSFSILCLPLRCFLCCKKNAVKNYKMLRKYKEMPFKYIQKYTLEISFFFFLKKSY